MPIFEVVCDSKTFANELLRFANWFSGVPDSDLSGTIAAITDWHYVPRENHAVGMAFGASLAGRKPSVLMQNSGLGLSLDAISGTFMLYRCPLLLVVSNRGVLPSEEPQHHHWGAVTINLLAAFGIENWSLDDYGLRAVELAARHAAQNEVPAAVIVERGNIAK